MSLFGAFAIDNHFDELANNYNQRGNNLTPAVRRNTAFQNLTGDSNILAADVAILEGLASELGAPVASGIVALDSDGFISYSVTNADSSGDLRPYNIQLTYTGSGATGGRARFGLTISGTMGGWSNAIKGHVNYGASGKTTGLGSAIVAELELSAGTTDGTYTPLEIELGLAASASTGTNTSLFYMNVYGANKAAFDTSGYFFNLQGLTAATGKVFRTFTEDSGPAIHATLRVKIGATDYYIPLSDSPNVT